MQTIRNAATTHQGGSLRNRGNRETPSSLAVNHGSSNNNININDESSSSGASHVQKYINTLAVVEANDNSRAPIVRKDAETSDPSSTYEAPTITGILDLESAACCPFDDATTNVQQQQPGATSAPVVIREEIGCEQQTEVEELSIIDKTMTKAAEAALAIRSSNFTFYQRPLETCLDDFDSIQQAPPHQSQQQQQQQQQQGSGDGDEGDQYRQEEIIFATAATDPLPPAEQNRQHEKSRNAITSGK